MVFFEILQTLRMVFSVFFVIIYTYNFCLLVIIVKLLVKQKLFLDHTMPRHILLPFLFLIHYKIQQLFYQKKFQILLFSYKKTNIINFKLLKQLSREIVNTNYFKQHFLDVFGEGGGEVKCVRFKILKISFRRVFVTKRDSPNSRIVFFFFYETHLFSGNFKVGTFIF